MTTTLHTLDPLRDVRGMDAEDDYHGQDHDFPPGIAIVLTILGITLIGESLNDLADPRLRARRRSKASQTPAYAVASHQPTAQEFMGEVQ